MNMNSNTTITELTPNQFLAARTLAKAYGHLWAGVPDGTYALKDIQAWAYEHQNENLPCGILEPSIEVDGHGDSYGTVTHTTGTGRLTWHINMDGDVRLEVNRPRYSDREERILHANGLHPEWDQHQQQGNIIVACIDLCSPEYNAPILHTPSWERSGGGIKDGWVYNLGIAQVLCFKRHVASLIRPIVSLLTLGKEYQLASMEEDYEEGRYEAWRASVLEPAIEQAKEMLAPLFEQALPDAWEPQYDHTARKTNEQPSICYMRYSRDPFSWNGKYTVHKGDESFIVETERAAVYATLVLERYPEMSLIEAISAAMESCVYRPEAVVEEEAKPEQRGQRPTGQKTV